MTKWLMCLALCMFALLAYTSSSHATPLLDPSTLQIGPGSTLDPVQIGSSGTVTVTNVSSGASDLNVPWLVILGIPNTTSTTAPKRTPTSASTVSSESLPGASTTIVNATAASTTSALRAARR